MDKNWKSIKYNDNWRDNQLDLLKRGEAIFGTIPDNIGEILYCDSISK